MRSLAHHSLFILVIPRIYKERCCLHALYRLIIIILAHIISCIYVGKLWTAPELLRIERPPPEGTPKGDVYSFAIITHEILVRHGPFYLADNDLSPRGKVNLNVLLLLEAICTLQREARRRSKGPFPHLHARLLSCTKGVSNCNGLLCLFYPFEEQLVFFFFLLAYDVYLYMFTSRCLYDDAGKTLSKLCPR